MNQPLSSQHTAARRLGAHLRAVPGQPAAVCDHVDPHSRPAQAPPMPGLPPSHLHPEISDPSVPSFARAPYSAEPDLAQQRRGPSPSTAAPRFARPRVNSASRHAEPGFARPRVTTHSDAHAFVWGLLCALRSMAVAPVSDVTWLWAHRWVLLRGVVSLSVPMVVAFYLVRDTVHATPTAHIVTFMTVSCLAFLAIGWAFFMLRQMGNAVRVGIKACIAKGHDWLEYGG